MVRIPSEVLVATSNKGKASEIRRVLKGLPFKIRTLRDFPFLHSVEELGESYQENATTKAIGYSAQTGMYTLADDSGLEVHALHGRPGIHSARFGGTKISDVERNQLLLMSLLHTHIHRAARFVTVAVLAAPEQSKPPTVRVLHTAKGICEGVIASTSRGQNGFGYDSIFIPNGYDRTFGELSDEIKNRVSHRTQAFLQMRDFLTWVSNQT